MSVVYLGFTLVLLLAASGKADEPLLEWRLNDSLADTSPFAHHGMSTGELTFGDGPRGGCLVLDGTGDYISADTTLPELTESFTIECWVNPGAEQHPYADIFGNHENEFTGFALQQDGEQTNHYYFTYGTGSAWIYSRTLALEAGRWQHFAAVKSADRLRIYIDGFPVDSVDTTAPMAPSSTPFMVGLGITGQSRFFTGAVSQVRIWSSARRPGVEPSPERWMEMFLSTGRVDAALPSRWGLIRPGGQGAITFRADPEMIPPAIGEIALAFDCRDAAGKACEFPSPVDLTRREAFSVEVPVPPTTGVRHVTVTPSVRVGGKRHALRTTAATYLALSPPDLTSPSVPTVPETPSKLLSRIVSLDGEWLLATDPSNEGVERAWWAEPRPEAVPTKVPWIIQDAFPGYHGVAWYWREFTAPEAGARSRTLLRFGAVDYKADVWLNDKALGSHEGAEGPFEFDVTDVIRPGEANRLAVRVLNPTNEPIDGMTLRQTPRRAKVIPYGAGASYNHGGIVGPVDLAVVPPVHITDLHLIPDTHTGVVRVEVTARNSGRRRAQVQLTLTVAPAVGGETIQRRTTIHSLPPGESVVRDAITAPSPHLWELADPYLYRVTARLAARGLAHEQSARCGFREFRFDDGYFRLNGRRIYLRGAHTVNATPVGQQVAGDPALFQRDVVLMKAMGMNCIRFIWGGATPRQLDICDEMGLLVYDEHAASNPMEMSPAMAERFDRSVSQIIRRDRNHPSVVIWGLLNETQAGPVFDHATKMLPLVRSLDETRMVLLNSGRWDGQLEIGSISNAGALGWDTYLGGEGPGAGTTGWGGVGGYFDRAGDAHIYPRVPQTPDTQGMLRTIGAETGPVFLTEYGIGSAVDLWRITRRFEQMGKPDAEDAVYYRERLERFLVDWRRWDMQECFADPQAFFAASLRKMAGQRTLGIDAIRANPKIVGYSLTGMMDHVNCGEGLFTLFRELKPGTTDAIAEGMAPLRLCVFAEPSVVFRGARVRLEAALANEDVLGPGDYPIRLQVTGPDLSRPFSTTVTVTIPEGEPPLAIPFFADDVPIDGPSGTYHFQATMLGGGAPTGGDTVLHVFDPADMPTLDLDVALFGDDPALREWLASRGARVGGLGDGADTIVIVAPPAAEASWAELVQRIESGATAISLTPSVFRRGEDATGWMPLSDRGTLKHIQGWLYLKDEWAKAHPIFDGLQAGGLMDYTLYSDIIPDAVFAGGQAPTEAVAGAIKASQDYDSGLMLGVHRIGSGRLVVNTLLIRENLPDNPIAERLLRNMLVWAAG